MSALPTCDLKRAAEILHADEETVAALARAGKIRGRKPGRKWVFVEADLAEYAKHLADAAAIKIIDIPACDGPGVYALIYRGFVVYVGRSSCNLFARLGKHRRDKQFDAVKWYPAMPGDDIDEIERRLIKECQPTYNSMHK